MPINVFTEGNLDETGPRKTATFGFLLHPIKLIGGEGYIDWYCAHILAWVVKVYKNIVNGQLYMLAVLLLN